MTREEAKVLLPIIQAFAEGKAIESRCIKGDKSLWYDDEDPSFDNDLEYRIKPEQKYRPFANVEECWHEMQKHQPFGWITFRCAFFHVIYIEDKLIGYGSGCGTILHTKLNDALEEFTFADGLPFGVKLDE